MPINGEFALQYAGPWRQLHARPTGPQEDIQVYEPKPHPPIPRRMFVRRLLLHMAAALALFLVSLLLGMAGYTYFEHLPWRDAFLNSAMLMGGMGPVDAPRTDGGKLFAGVYALYAGLVFLVGAGLIFAPVVHRVMHKFHWEQ
jgi:hypothetical protein